MNDNDFTDKSTYRKSVCDNSCSQGLFSEEKNQNVKWSSVLEKNVTWNPIIEKNVLEIGEKAKGYKIMHTQESEIVGTTYDILMFSGIILGPLSALISSIGVILSPPDTNIILPIISACVGFVSGIIVAITKYGKYEEKSSKHKLAASKYTSLESNVRRQLALCRSDRVNAAQYLEWIGNSFDELFLVSPLVAKKIYDEYAEIAKEKGLIVPDEYKITINVDEKLTEMKIKEMKDISKININRSPLSVKVSEDFSEKSPVIPKPLEINRSDTITNLPELNKFSDGRMEYELRRMINL